MGKIRKIIPVGTKTVRLERACWTLRRETFSGAGMGNSGRKVVGGEPNKKGSSLRIKSLEYHSEEVRFCSGDSGGFY